MDFDLGQAQKRLKEAKEDTLTYLKLTYKTEAEALATYQYFESVVDKIIKRQQYRISFEAGGSPLWHSEALMFLSEWIAAENELGLIITHLIEGEST